jgi:hypothetical protein
MFMGLSSSAEQLCGQAPRGLQDGAEAYTDHG